MQAILRVKKRAKHVNTETYALSFSLILSGLGKDLRQSLHYSKLYDCNYLRFYAECCSYKTKSLVCTLTKQNSVLSNRIEIN